MGWIVVKTTSRECHRWGKVGSWQVCIDASTSNRLPSGGNLGFGPSGQNPSCLGTLLEPAAHPSLGALRAIQLGLCPNKIVEEGGVCAMVTASHSLALRAKTQVAWEHYWACGPSLPRVPTGPPIGAALPKKSNRAATN